MSTNESNIIINITRKKYLKLINFIYKLKTMDLVEPINVTIDEFKTELGIADRNYKILIPQYINRNLKLNGFTLRKLTNKNKIRISRINYADKIRGNWISEEHRHQLVTMLKEI